ncbi:MAG: PQQ-binding-like beta-propeller repeat protein [Phycisphaeraceae bacterium]
MTRSNLLRLIPFALAVPLIAGHAFADGVRIEAEADASVHTGSITNPEADGSANTSQSRPISPHPLLHAASDNAFKYLVRFDTTDAPIEAGSTVLLHLAIVETNREPTPWRVYALNDDFTGDATRLGQDWDPRRVTWNNAPGNDPHSATEVDEDATTLAGTIFWEHNEAFNARRSLDVSRFVRQPDTRYTFWVVQADPTVHNTRIASSRHTTTHVRPAPPEAFELRPRLTVLPPAPSIAWADDWQTTDTRTWSRWESELEKETDPTTRRLLADVWRAELLEALLERFDAATETGFQARRELIQLYAHLGRPDRQVEHSRAIIDAPQASAAAIRQALQRVVDSEAARHGRIGEAAWRLNQIDNANARAIGREMMLERLGAVESLVFWRRWQLENLAEPGSDWARRLETELARNTWRGGNALERRVMLSQEQGLALLDAAEQTFENLQEQPPASEAMLRQLDALFADATTADAEMLPRTAHLHSDAGRTIDAMIRGHVTAAQYQALAEHQEAGLRRPLPRDFGREQTSLAAARRRPYAPSTQHWQIAMGDLHLRAGRPGFALRYFQDVQAITHDDALKRRAEEGINIVRAHLDHETPNASARHLELRTVDLPRNAGPIRGSRSTMGQDIPRPQARLQNDDAGMLVSSAGFFAAYPANAAEPAWTHRLEGDLSHEHTLNGPLRTPLRPAFDDSRVALGWGEPFGSPSPHPPAVFDRHTGEQLWSADDTDAWANRVALGSPAIDEGRLYQLAREGDGPIADLHLLCHDAQTGDLLWQRRLASAVTDLVVAVDDDGTYTFDVARYGATITASEGAVYIASQLGAVVRLDARDGRIEWLHRYYGADNLAARNQMRWWHLVPREGGPPLLTEEQVIVLPHDRHGVFALDRDTGQLLWDDALLPSWWTAGIVDGQLITAEQHLITATDPATGQPQWTHHLPEPITIGPVAGPHSTWFIDQAGEIHGLDPATGDPLPLASGRSTPATLHHPVALTAHDSRLTIITHHPPHQR